MSQNSKAADPRRALEGMRRRWSALRIRALATCGTASPIKPTGPQKAVTLPDRRTVERKSTFLDDLTFIPMLLA